MDALHGQKWTKMKAGRLHCGPKHDPSRPPYRMALRECVLLMLQVLFLRRESASSASAASAGKCKNNESEKRNQCHRVKGSTAQPLHIKKKAPSVHIPTCCTQGLGAAQRDATCRVTLSVPCQQHIPCHCTFFYHNHLSEFFHFSYVPSFLCHLLNCDPPPISLPQLSRPTLSACPLLLYITFHNTSYYCNPLLSGHLTEYFTFLSCPSPVKLRTFICPPCELVPCRVLYTSYQHTSHCNLFISFHVP